MSLSRDQVGSVERIVKELLERIGTIKEKEKHQIRDLKSTEKTVEVEYQGEARSGAERMYIKIFYDEPVELLATFLPAYDVDGSEYILSHILEKNAWNDDMSKIYDKRKLAPEARFPGPLGTGGIEPLPHHWSEYAGQVIISYITKNKEDVVPKIIAKLASALGAKKETIDDVLGKEFTENKQKISSLVFDNFDAKATLYYYIVSAQRKLNQALRNYGLLQDSSDAKDYKNINKIDAVKGKIEKQKTEIIKLEKELTETKFAYDKSNYYLIHPDINIDNITVNNCESIVFIDGALPRGKKLEDFVGPRQIYYYLFKEIRDREKSRTEGTYTSIVETYDKLAKLLDNLEKILAKDYDINGKNKTEDALVEKIVKSYFASWQIRRESKADLDKIFGKNSYRKFKTKLEEFDEDCRHNTLFSWLESYSTS